MQLTTLLLSTSAFLGASVLAENTIDHDFLPSNSPCMTSSACGNLPALTQTCDDKTDDDDDYTNCICTTANRPMFQACADCLISMKGKSNNNNNNCNDDDDDGDDDNDDDDNDTDCDDDYDYDDDDNDVSELMGDCGWPYTSSGGSGSPSSSTMTSTTSMMMTSPTPTSGGSSPTTTTDDSSSTPTGTDDDNDNDNDNDDDGDNNSSPSSTPPTGAAPRATAGVGGVVAVAGLAAVLL